MSIKRKKTVLMFGLVAAMALIGVLFIMSGSTFAAVAAPITGSVQPAISQPTTAPPATPMAVPPAGVQARPSDFGAPFFGGFGLNPFFGGFGLNPFFGGFGFNPFFNEFGFNEGVFD
jgi:hypothetical protein